MKKGRDYDVGDVLQHGACTDTVMATWTYIGQPKLTYIITGKSWELVTIYAVETDGNIGPRLARYVPLALFLEIGELATGQPSTRKRTKKVRKAPEPAVEVDKPAISRRRRQAPAKEEAPPLPPPVRARRQRRKE